jgi:hypothetical protein
LFSHHTNGKDKKTVKGLAAEITKGWAVWQRVFSRLLLKLAQSNFINKAKALMIKFY